MKKHSKEINRRLSRLATDATQPAYEAHKKRLTVEFVTLVKAGNAEEDALERLQRETLVAIFAQRRAVQL